MKKYIYILLIVLVMVTVLGATTAYLLNYALGIKLTWLQGAAINVVLNPHTLLPKGFRKSE